MLTNQTQDRLHDMKLSGMAAAYEEQRLQPQIADLDFDERFAMLVERQWLWREERALTTRLRAAQFKVPACIEQLDYSILRGLKRTTINHLAACDWIKHHQNLILTGPTGTGKTFIACAIGTHACRTGYRVRYFVAAKLFRMLRRAHADGSFPRLMTRLTRTDLLIIDDWGMETLKAAEYRDLLEILDDRQGSASVMMASQFHSDLWHETIGNPTVADAILDRLVHNAHHIALEGESVRKLKGVVTS